MTDSDDCFIQACMRLDAAIMPFEWCAVFMLFSATGSRWHRNKVNAAVEV